MISGKQGPLRFLGQTTETIKKYKFNVVLTNKKRGNDGIKDSYFHMSPVKGDSSQDTFFAFSPQLSPAWRNGQRKGALATGGVSGANDETYGNPSFGRYFLCYKKGAASAAPCNTYLFTFVISAQSVGAHDGGVDVFRRHCKRHVA